MHHSLFSEYIVYYSVHVISVKWVVGPVQLSCNGQLKLPFVIYSNIQLTFFSNTKFDDFLSFELCPRTWSFLSSQVAK